MLVLGTTSLITDISSEMVTAVIPLYLTAQLGFGVVAFGIFEGAYQASSALLRLWGASLADRANAHKGVATMGYGISAATRFGLVASVGASISPIPFLLVDRLGKGIRAAPRDALIALSTDPRYLGTAFGIHRAMDTAGALAGPLLAFVILDLVPDGFDAVFVMSALIATAGVAVISLLAQPARVDRPAGAATRTGRDIRDVLGQRGVLRVATVAGGLAALSVSDAFIYLVLHRRTDMDPWLFPLLFAGTAASYLLLAVPFGRLADRYGRRRVFLAGHLPLIVLYAGLAHVDLTTTAVLGCLVLLGSYWAATDGLVPAIASTLVPDHHRTGGIAVVTVAVALGRLVASGLFGLAWSILGVETTLHLFLGGLVLGLPVAAAALGGAPRSSEVAP